MTSTPPQPTTATPTHIAHKILSRAHPEPQATKLFTDKIRNKPLLLTPTVHTDKRTLRRKTREHKTLYHRAHQKPRPLSAQEKRTLKIHDLPAHEIKYSVYAGLHELWRGYILEVLGFMKDGEVAGDVDRRVVSQAGHGALIASADFHGMQIEVVRCADVGRVGLKGIVVRETRGCFVVVTERDQLRRVLKRGAVFRVVVPLPTVGEEEDNTGAGAANREGRKTEEGEETRDTVTDTVQRGKRRELVFDLHGNQLEIRPVDRAMKKFKWHTMDYL